jgi:TetR/AcrR family tetracycline transcriptional repressor
VVSAALDVIDKVGVENLTIRAVAAAVGAPPMSLYTHFTNKEELLDLMYVELSRRLYPDSGQPTWQGEMSALARHIRSTLLEHRHWTPLLSRRVAVTSAVAVRERILTLMVESGLRADAALAGLSAVVLGTIGFVLAELRFREGDGGSAIDRRFERLKSHFEEQPEGKEPTTRQAFVGTPSFAMEKSFEMMLETLILGLEHHTAAAP